MFRGQLVSDGLGKDACRLEQDEKLFEATRTHPLFAELLLNMIDELPDDVVSWSAAGNSFVITKVPVFEGALPSYYSHGNFTSFVRQLNNYGFQRIKRSLLSSLVTVGSGEEGAVATAATTRALPWEEFSHPLFRRGRPDLLVRIHRHKKGACLRPRPVHSEELDMLNSLGVDVGALCGDLRTVNGKLENIMSLLSDLTSGQNHAAPNNSSRGAVVGASCSSDCKRRNVVSSAAAPAGVVHGGWVGFGGWAGGRDREGDGGMGRVGQDLSAVGAPPDHFVGRYFSADHHQQGAGNHHPFYLPSPQMPSSTQQYPAGPHQVRHFEGLPPRAAPKAARATESACVGQSH